MMKVVFKHIFSKYYSRRQLISSYHLIDLTDWLMIEHGKIDRLHRRHELDLV